MTSSFERGGQKPKEEKESNIVEAGPQIERFNDIADQFERMYDLSMLRAIETEEQAAGHPIRDEANLKALPFLVSQFNLLRFSTDTNITEEQFEQVRLRYQKISQAVGMRNSGLVDHTREAPKKDFSKSK